MNYLAFVGLLFCWAEAQEKFLFNNPLFTIKKTVISTVTTSVRATCFEIIGVKACRKKKEIAFFHRYDHIDNSAHLQFPSPALSRSQQYIPLVPVVWDFVKHVPSPSIESSFDESQREAGSEGRSFLQYTTETQFTTVTAKLVGTQTFVVSCIAPGSPIPTPQCEAPACINAADCAGNNGGVGTCTAGACVCTAPATLTAGKCNAPACINAANCAGTNGGAGTCTNGACVCSAPSTLTAGKCNAPACINGFDCAGTNGGAGACRNSVCVCTGRDTLVGGKCNGEACVNAADCTGNNGGVGTCAAGACGCTAPSLLTSGKCDAPACINAADCAGTNGGVGACLGGICACTGTAKLVGGKCNG